MVVRLGKVFKKILGMGEWAPPWVSSSSPTPSPLRVAVCVHKEWCSGVRVRYKIERSCFFRNSTVVLFYPLERAIVLGFLCLCSYVSLLMSYLYVMKRQSKGFPLFARVTACLGVSYCFAHLLINALLVETTKA